MFVYSDTNSVLSQIGTQFPGTSTSPWSFYSCQLRMRLVCIPAIIPARGMDLVRLSVKAEIAVRDCFTDCHRGTKRS